MPNKANPSSDINNKLIKAQIKKDIQDIKYLVARVENSLSQLDLEKSDLYSEDSASDAKPKAATYAEKPSFNREQENSTPDLSESSSVRRRFRIRGRNKKSKPKSRPKDHHGKYINKGDYVKSVGAPYHNGIVDSVDHNWVYIIVSSKETPRKKAPYNVIVQ